jgi:hypothetical protein
MKGKKYFNCSLLKITLVLPGCESTVHFNFGQVKAPSLPVCDESIPARWSAQLSPWSAGPGRVSPKLPQVYFLSRSYLAHNCQAGVGEQENQVEEAVLTTPFS